MKKYLIKLNIEQYNLLLEVLRRASEMELYDQPEWLEDWLLVSSLNGYFLDKPLINEISLEGKEPWAIMNFLSSFMDEDRLSVSAVTHYKNMKLFQEIFWQSSFYSNADPEDWKWFIQCYYPDPTPQIRKW